MTLGEKIQNLRKERGMTQTEFAECFGVSRQAVSKWELDQMMPELSKLIEIADDFEVSLDELVRGKEKRNEGQKNVVEGGMEKSKRPLILLILFTGFMGIWLLYGSIPESRWKAANLIDMNFLILIMLSAAVTVVIKLVFYQKYKFMELYRYVVIVAGVILAALMLTTHLKYGLTGLHVSMLPFFYSLVLVLAVSFPTFSRNVHTGKREQK